MIRVLLCDDHRIVREGIKQVLAEDPAFTVVGEAASADEAEQQVRLLMAAGGVDLMLLDIALPGRDGLALLSALRQVWPQLPVLMLSTYPERQYAARCIQLGAAGYLHKSADPDDMLAAMHHAARGEHYLSPTAAQAVASALSRTNKGRGLPTSAGIESLSHREHQVFRLLTLGRSVSEIGAELGLASNTVSTYRARILEKTGARNDVELALLAHRVEPAG